MSMEVVVNHKRCAEKLRAQRDAKRESLSSPSLSPEGYKLVQAQVNLLGAAATAWEASAVALERALTLSKELEEL